MKPLTNNPRSAPKRAFSLVEVTLALGILTFSLMVIIGLLPVGLQTIRDTSIEKGISSIVSQVSAEMQQMPLSAVDDSGYSIEALPDTTYFYSLEGTRVDENSDEAFYSVTFATGQITLPTGSADPSSTFDSHLQQVFVNISYPLNAPTDNRTLRVLPIVIAQ